MGPVAAIGCLTIPVAIGAALFSALWVGFDTAFGDSAFLFYLLGCEALVLIPIGWFTYWRRTPAQLRISVVCAAAMVVIALFVALHFNDGNDADCPGPFCTTALDHLRSVAAILAFVGIPGWLLIVIHAITWRTRRS